MNTHGSGPPAGISGPPYPPQRLGLGLTPTVLPDVPVDAVFLALFTLSAGAHMGLFQFNMHKRHKKFAFNAAIFGFCITRILATSLRMAWVYQPHNVSLALAAQIFVYAGTIILFISNLFFSQRVVRAQHPKFGWSTPFSIWLPILAGLIVATILLLISAVIVQFYMPDATTQHWTRGIQMYGATLFGVAAFLPIPIVLISALTKSLLSNKEASTDNFGMGSITSKIIIIVASAILLSLGAWWRAVTSLINPTPISQLAPWYLSKVCFYVFDFGVEIVTITFWLFIRIDKRFIIPDGAKGPYSYGNGTVFAGETGNEKLPPNPSSRNLIGSSGASFATTAGHSRWSSVDSFGSTMTKSRIRSRPSRVSWGGRTQTVSTLGEEEDTAVSRENSFELQRPLSIVGADLEMGYDGKSGQWTTRPLSVCSNRTQPPIPIPGAYLPRIPDLPLRVYK